MKVAHDNNINGKIDTADDTIEENLRIPIITKHFRDDKILIEILFNNSFATLDKEYLESQLSDVNSIRYNDDKRLYVQSQGYNTSIGQAIQFLMPARDVTLYLREKDYRFKLKLIREKDTKYFDRVDICTDYINASISREGLYSWGDQWYDVPYKAGDTITITVYFNPEEGHYSEIDTDFMKAQMPTIIIGPRGDKNNVEPYLGYKDLKQTITFTMPPHDVELILKETTLFKELIIRRDPYQLKYAKKQIQGVEFTSIFENKKSISFSVDQVLKVIVGEKVKIKVIFPDDRMRIDGDNFYGQIIPDEICEPGEDENKNSLGSDLYQLITVVIPNKNDLILYLRWMERKYIFSINYESKFFSSIEYTLKSPGTSTNSTIAPFYGSIDLYTKDLIVVEFIINNDYDIKPENCDYKIYTELKEDTYKGINSNDAYCPALPPDDYFHFKLEDKKLIITSTIKKKNIDITLNYLFKGLSKFVCSNNNFGNPDYATSIAKETNGAMIVAWGGGPRGFCYINKNVTIKPGTIHLHAGPGAPGGSGGEGSFEKGEYGKSGSPWAYITYNNYNSIKQQTIALGQGGNGGDNGNSGAGNPAVGKDADGSESYLIGKKGDRAPGRLDIDTFQSFTEFTPINTEPFPTWDEAFNNKYTNKFTFVAATGGDKRQSTYESNYDGSGGAPSCGGSGEGGEGVSTYEQGKKGGIVDLEAIVDGCDRFHFPLYCKEDLKNDILDILNENKTPEEIERAADEETGEEIVFKSRWEKEFSEDEKNKIINDESGVFIYIPADDPVGQP